MRSLNILDKPGSVNAFDSNNWGTLPKGTVIPLTNKSPQPKAEGFTPSPGYGGYNRIFVLPYDGEKDLGEMGPIRKYLIDNTALRLRSWQLFLESDVCQALFKRSAMWGIGTGLKVKAAPKSNVLNKEKIELTSEKFNKQIEERFGVFASSTMCDYSGLNNLNEMATEAWINADVGGDILLIIRLVDNMPKIQMVDGSHVRSPLMWGTSVNMNVINPKNQNIIRHGIEYDKTGRHVAYWIYTGNDVIGEQSPTNYERIQARMDKYPYSETARLIYGLKYRLDNNRGIPLITAVMETAAKMSRYREASLSGAEERAKINFAIEHENISTGENPFTAQAAQASGFGPQTDIPADSLGNNLSNKVYATTNKQTVNMPRGAKLHALESKQELNFRDFYEVNFDIVCAVAGYPPEVILSKYDSNYSASRAAIKDFEHSLTVKRNRFASQFYQVIYNFCLDWWCLSDAIDAPGYLSALASQNEFALAAYRTTRWTGDQVPHIDPYKEVQSMRALLGKDSENFPLSTIEDVVERLGSGSDYTSIVEQYAEEIKEGEKLGVEKVLQRGEQPEQGSEGVKPAQNGNPQQKRKNNK